MANSKRRCKFCGDYFPVAELTKYGLGMSCQAQECLLAARTGKATQKKVAARKAAPPQKNKNPGAPAAIRRVVRERDQNACRFCGRQCLSEHGNGEVHHITYRSQISVQDPWRDHLGNLILLCDEHHGLVHSNKRVWQPILRACIWLHYAEGRRLTIPKTWNELKARGIIEPDEEMPT